MCFDFLHSFVWNVSHSKKNSLEFKFAQLLMWRARYSCQILTKFNNCPTRCELFSLLHFCRQLYMFRVLTSIIRSSYSCNYSFWYWLTRSNTIRSRWWDSSTCFGCWHPSPGARTTVNTASGTGQPGLLPSALVGEFQLKNESGR